jgi:hypothetical protein
MNLESIQVALEDPKMGLEERRLLNKIMIEYANGGFSQTYYDLLKQDYDEIPVSVEKFLDDPYYMGLAGRLLYPKWREEVLLVLDAGNRITEWIVTGGIGSGKSYACRMALAYKLYLLTCMKSPQEFYLLASFTKIYFAFFNVNKILAEEGNYREFTQMLQTSPYFRSICKKPVRQSKWSWETVTDLILPKNLGFVLGSNVTHALGHAVYGGLLDEANFEKGNRSNPAVDTGKGKMYNLYEQVRSRLTSRFQRMGEVAGLLCIASSKFHETDFLEKHIAKVKSDPGTYISNYAVWETKHDWDDSKRFYVVTGDSHHRPSIHDERPNDSDVHGRIVEVPVDFRLDFEKDIDVALRDKAGVATYGLFPFITAREKVHECINTSRSHPYDVDTVFLSVHDKLEPGENGPLIDGFKKTSVLRRVDEIRDRWNPIHHPFMPRYIHVDLAKNQCAAGFSMGCPYDIKKVQRKDKDDTVYRSQDYRIFIDMMIRIEAKLGSEIDFSHIVAFIEYLRRVGYPIEKVTFDTYQSVHSLQMLSKAGFKTGNVSMDRTTGPYMALKAAIYDGRIDYYAYEPFVREITRIHYDSKRGKVDHVEGESKDVSDCVAAVTYSIMQDNDIPIQMDITDKMQLIPSVRRSMEVDPVEEVLPGYHKGLEWFDDWMNN